MNPETSTPSPLVTAAQNITGLPPNILEMIIEYTSYIDLNNPAGSQQYTDYVRSLITNAVEGDGDGGQGLDYFIRVIGEELAVLSYIEANLSQLDDGAQVVMSEEHAIPDRPVMQHEGVGRGVTAAHHLIEEWNEAVRSGTVDRSRFANLGTVQGQLNDLSGELWTIKDQLLNLASQLP